MANKIIGMLTGMVAGYFLGMMIGFTLFDPNSDLWALFGAVLAFIGLGIGLMPRFRQNVTVVLGALIGFYFGLLLRVPLFGMEDEFDLLENGPGSLVCALVGTVLGAWLAAHYDRPGLSTILFAALLAGSIGGYVFGVALGLASGITFTDLWPFVVVSGIAAAYMVLFWQRRRAALT